MTLANGDVLTADMLVGADGYQSIVRDVVLEDEDMVKPGGLTLYTGVVDAEEMLKDPELRPYALSDEVSTLIISPAVPADSTLSAGAIFSGPSGWDHTEVYVVRVCP